MRADIEEVGRQAVDAAIKVHRTLGPGLLETVYEHCLSRELILRGLKAARQVHLPIIYEGERLEGGLRLDLVIEEAVIVEVKSVENLGKLHEAQLLTYLRLSGLRLGFLMNFNVPLLKGGYAAWSGSFVPLRVLCVFVSKLSPTVCGRPA